MADGSGPARAYNLGWTDDEDAKLRESYERGGLDAARQALPHRTDGALYCRATRLRLRAPKKPRVRLAWDHIPGLDAELRAAHARNAPAGTYAAIARRWNRPSWYVSRRAVTLGCRLAEPGPGRPWSEDEDTLVIATAASTCASAARTFKRHGYNRSARGIASRRYELSVERSDGGEHSANALAALLGVTHGPVRRWIESGALKARRDTDAGDRRYLIRERDLRAFMVANPCAFSLRTLPPASQPWLVNVLAGNFCHD